MNLVNVSYKDLDIGQKIYILQECGIDCSYFIETHYLSGIYINKNGIRYIEVTRGNNEYVCDCEHFYKIFTTQQDAVKYCEENGLAYQFLIERN